MCKRKHAITGLLFVSIIMLIGWSDQAQSQEKYPTRAIEIIVAAAAGGSSDITARLTASYLNKKWGVPVNVINKPGGDFIPGTLVVYQAAPNGYTMLADHQSSTSILEAAVKNLPFKIMDRTFIGMHSTSPFVLFVPSTSPYKTLEDFIAEVKKNPGNLSYTAQGNASGIEYTIRQLFSAIGVDISKLKRIPTQGGAQVVVLTAGGHVTLGSATVTSVLPAVKGETVRPLLITSKDRFGALPDVATSAELGYPTVNCVFWNGISGPPNLPSHIADMWSKALEEMVKDPGFISQLKNVGSVPFYLDAQATREYVKKELEEVSKLFR